MKYEGNKAVVDEPSIWRISNNSVTVLKAGGTESFSYEGNFIMQVGDIQAYAPIDIEPEDVPEITPVTPTPNPGSEDNPGGGGESGGESGGETPGGGDNPNTPVNPDPIPGSSYMSDNGPNNGIRINFINNTGQSIKFTGKFGMYADGFADSNEIQLNFDAPNSTTGGHPHWTVNNHILENGGSVYFDFNTAIFYNGDGTNVTETRPPISNYVGRNFMTYDSGWPNGIPAIKLGVRAKSKTSGDESTGPMYHISPLPSGHNKVTLGKTYNLIIDDINANYTVL